MITAAKQNAGMVHGDVPTRIGIAGTGHAGRHFALAVKRQQGFELSRVLTRRPLGRRDDFSSPIALTASIEDLLDNSDVLFECSGDVLHATDVIDRAIASGLPVVTFGCEFHVTVGSYFVVRGMVTEAEGDQPGSLAALAEEADVMGFRPLVYGNMKGFLNHNPTRSDMEMWADRHSISLRMVTAFTDGTKLQIEQALVANGLGATIAEPGLIGPASDDLGAAATELAVRAKAIGHAISDYVLSPQNSHGVFIVAEHEPNVRDALRYLKLGDGPFYLLTKPNALTHLEAMKTVMRVTAGGPVLLDNSTRPTISVAAVAKRDLAAGAHIAYGIGSFEVYGTSVFLRDNAGHLPIGLLQDATLRRDVAAGQMLGIDDVELPESLALAAWQAVERQALTAPAQRTAARPLALSG